MSLPWAAMGASKTARGLRGDAVLFATIGAECLSQWVTASIITMLSAAHSHCPASVAGRVMVCLACEPRFTTHGLFTAHGTSILALLQGHGSGKIP